MVTWAIDRAEFELPKNDASLPKEKNWLKPIIQYLNGEKLPTMKQWEAFSKKVYLPFGYLFFSEPPKEEWPIPYFRSTAVATKKVNIHVYDTILLMQQRQDWLRDYLLETGSGPLPFVGQFRNSTDVSAIVSSIRQVLELPENWAKEFGSWTKARDHLVKTIEEKGIIISFNSVVENNTHRKIPVEECRGFVLVDEMAPFMFVNSGDFISAQLFTIAHELAHIWTGQSAGFDFRKLQPANNPIEKLCDRVAAEFLVPEKAFNKVWKGDIDEAARHFKVSQIVVARRALDLGKWTKERFFDFYEEYRKRDMKKKDKPSGGNFYATAKKRLGGTFVTYVDQAVRSDQLLYRDAYRLTGLWGDTYEHFAVTQL